MLHKLVEHRSKLSSNDNGILHYLMLNLPIGGIQMPPIVQIAQDLGIARTNVSTSLKKLEQLNFIAKVNRTNWVFNPHLAFNGSNPAWTQAQIRWDEVKGIPTAADYNVVDITSRKSKRIKIEKQEDYMQLAQEYGIEV